MLKKQRYLLHFNIFTMIGNVYCWNNTDIANIFCSRGFSPQVLISHTLFASISSWHQWIFYLFDGDFLPASFGGNSFNVSAVCLSPSSKSSLHSSESMDSSLPDCRSRWHSDEVTEYLLGRAKIFLHSESVAWILKPLLPNAKMPGGRSRDSLLSSDNTDDSGEFSRVPLSWNRRISSSPPMNLPLMNNKGT